LQLQWSDASRRDLLRLYDFLQEVNPRAAMRILRELNAAAKTLTEFPELGQRLELYESETVRSFLAGDYEIRYQIQPNAIYVVRIWHTREDR
jgi:plasmid stabilization system protein ParE